MEERAVLTAADGGGRSRRASAVLARQQPGGLGGRLLAGISPSSRAVSPFSLEFFTCPAGQLSSQPVTVTRIIMMPPDMWLFMQFVSHPPTSISRKEILIPHPTRGRIRERKCRLQSGTFMLS